jgi:hypothetical protein
MKLLFTRKPQFQLILNYAVAGLVCLGFCLFFGTRDYRNFLNLNPPFEDASMLFKYANSLAHGGGISWNPGKNPGITDGATDLGFVASIALLVRFGISVVRSAALINGFSIFLLGVAVYHFSRRISKEIPNILLILTFIAIGCGPLDRFLRSGFSPAVLGLLYLLEVGVLLTVGASDEKLKRKYYVIAGLVSGLCGWWRPEGFYFSVLFGIFSLGTVDYFKAAKPTKLGRNIRWLIFPYLALLFLWISFRILYFGHLLPTSAVMKAESGLHFGNFYESSRFILIGISPLLLVSILYATRRLAVYEIFLFSFILILSASWIPVATTLNWWHRMQWPLIPPLLLLIIYGLQKSKVQGIFLTNKLIIAVVFMSILTVGFQFQIHRNEQVNFPEFTKSVSSALSSVDTSSVKLATTEAGLIPLTITGESLDAYGWNDYSIAKSDGKNLLPRLEQFSPNLIMMHGLPPKGTVPYSCKVNYFTKKWNLMTRTISNYALTHKFKLFRSILTAPCDAWSVYVSQFTSRSIRNALEIFKVQGKELVSSRPESSSR